MIPTDEQVEQAAQAIAYNTTNGLVTVPDDMDRDVARAVLVAVGPHIAAQALRDAGSALVFDLTAADGYGAWLRRRADQIEKEAGR